MTFVADGGALVQAPPVLELVVASELEKERLDGTRVSGGEPGRAAFVRDAERLEGR